MEEVMVSVIVPVYNGDLYIRQTMDCIVGQTEQNIEVICVDDGSTDHTPEIIEEYVKKDSRVCLIRCKKANAGASRNMGMTRAKGKYLLFWDGDDLFESDAISLMVEQIEKDDADICVCDADQYDTKEKIYIKKPQYLNKSRLPKQIPFSKYTNGKYIFNFSSQVAWNKLFRREFIQKNEIFFQEIPRINDHYFVSVATIMAESITVIDKVLVHYRVYQDTNLTGQSSIAPLCKYEVQCDVKDKLEELDLFGNPKIKQSFVNKALNTMIHGLNIQNDLSGYQALYNQLKREGLERLELRDYGSNYFYNELEYNNLLLMYQLNCEEYLFQKGIDYRRTNEKKNVIISDLKKELKDLKKEFNKINGELNYIKGTRRYKIVATMTRAFNQLRGKGKRKRHED